MKCENDMCILKLNIQKYFKHTFQAISKISLKKWCIPNNETVWEKGERAIYISYISFSENTNKNFKLFIATRMLYEMHNWFDNVWLLPTAHMIHGWRGGGGGGRKCCF